MAACNQPNILTIICDQLRYDSVGFSGENAVCGRPVKTPNLDRLAQEGLWFDNAYTTLPSCCPARQAMLAGKRPETFGALWNYDITSKVASLQPSQPNWPVQMQQQGYRMAWIGKWHVSPEYTPLDFGFESYYSDVDYLNWRRENYPNAGCEFSWFGNVDSIPLEASHTHVLAAKAEEKIREFADSETPWHIQLNFSEPHLPCEPCKEFAELYDAADMKPWPSFEETFEGKPYIQKQNVYTWGNENRTWEEWSHNAARYFAVISQTDDAIGRVLAELERSGAAENTLIIFTADHGDMCGSHRMIDKHYVLYDDITHVPLILRAPGAKPRRIEGFVNNCLDMTATMLEACRAVPFANDGVSWMPLLQNAQEENPRDFAVCTLNGQQFGLYSQRMLRTRDWKYIWNLTDVDELYDMQNDPWEMTNRIYDPALKPLIAELRQKLYRVLKKEDPDILRGGWLEAQLLENKKL